MIFKTFGLPEIANGIASKTSINAAPATNPQAVSTDFSDFENKAMKLPINKAVEEARVNIIPWRCPIPKVSLT
jgi:hypothetical protein